MALAMVSSSAAYVAAGTWSLTEIATDWLVTVPGVFSLDTRSRLTPFLTWSCVRSYW